MYKSDYLRMDLKVKSVPALVTSTRTRPALKSLKTQHSVTDVGVEVEPLEKVVNA